MSKEKPLTKGDIFDSSELEDNENPIIPSIELEDVLSALALAKKKMEDFCNKNNIDDCGGMEEAIEILDECFQIQEGQGNAKGREDKELVSSEIVRANSKDLTFSQDSPAQQNQEGK